jgi:hypothetical protein
MLSKVKDNIYIQDVSSGYLVCGGKSGTLIKGESVWVGSISSGEGYRTTPVEDFWVDGEVLLFRTRNSLYQVRCLGKQK